MNKKRRRKTGWWIAGIILVAAAVAAYGLWGQASEPDPSPLAGKWLRPDGGYVLELSNGETKGQLKAAYFNPRPINVGKAQWKVQDNQLQVFVELSDEHYPGSTYTLRYDPATDQLTGIYYQAVQRQQFQVRFIRKK